MDILQFFSDYWYVIIFIISLVFTLGRMAQNMKSYVTLSNVSDEVKKALENHCPFIDKIDEVTGESLSKKIDTRIDIHPMIKDYKVTLYRIDQLEPDVKEIKANIGEITLAIARLDKNGG